MRQEHKGEIAGLLTFFGSMFVGLWALEHRVNVVLGAYIFVTSLTLVMLVTKSMRQKADERKHREWDEYVARQKQVEGEASEYCPLCKASHPFNVPCQ